MKRLEQDYRDALDGLRFSDEAKERMMKNITDQKEHKPAKRRGFRPLRAGLVAAALCLALAGTAMAANPEAVDWLIARLTVQVEDDGYHVGSAPMTKYPLDEFSPALNAASEGRDGPGVVQLRFATWEEARAFLGKDVPVVWPDGGRGWDAHISVYLFHTETDRLWGIDINSVSISGQVEVNIEIRTEHWRGEEASSEFGLVGGSVEAMGSYSMANGCIAEMVKYLGPKEPRDAAACSGHFIKNGILYNVSALGSTASQEEMETRLKNLLDSFE